MWDNRINPILCYRRTHLITHFADVRNDLCELTENVKTDATLPSLNQRYLLRQMLLPLKNIFSPVFLELLAFARGWTDIVQEEIRKRFRK